MQPFSKSMYENDLVTYYDAMRQYRDYGMEARFADSLIKRHDPQVNRVLDICCGTGSHALKMSELGYHITGIDQSPEMLAVAKEKTAGAGYDIGFHCTSVSGFEPEERFDAAYCLGYTFLYMTSYDKVTEFFRAVHRMIKPGALFMIDFINGWSLIKDFDRDKATYQVDGTTIFHFEHAVLDRPRRIKHIDFQYIIDDHDGHVRTVTAGEDLRIFFEDEVKMLLASCGFGNVSSFTDYSEDTGSEKLPEIIIVSGTKAGE